MNRKKYLILSGALLCFVFITVNVIGSLNTGEPLAVDTVIREGILGLRCRILNVIMTIITYMGNSETIIFICIALLFFKKTRTELGVPLTVTISLSSILHTAIKLAVQRPRPPVTDFIISQGGYSFPSGHSCSALVFYGLFAYLIIHMPVDKTVGKVAAVCGIALAAAIGFSRIYVGVHYPTDVLGGWSLGIVVLTTAITIIEWLKKPVMPVK